MPWGGDEGAIVATARWAALIERLERSDDDHERLALCVESLSHWRKVVVDVLAVFPNVIARIDVDDAVAATEVWGELTHAADDHDAAHALVRAVHLTDARLAALDDRVDARSEEEDPTVAWGPFPVTIGGGELRLLRRPRRTVQSADKRDVVISALRHHQLLSPLPPGLAWDTGLVGHADAERRRAHRAALRAAGQAGLRVLLWPGTRVEPTDFGGTGECAVVDPDTAERDALVAEVDRAVRLAAADGVHVLLLPELYLHPEDLDLLGGTIRELDPPPLLTVVGLTHQAAGDRWRNEAVVLDTDGDVIWRHVKANPFIAEPGATGGLHVGECLEAGGSVVLRHCALGWITTLICVDVFTPGTAEALDLCAPALVLVPSLSRRTTPHGNAAERLRAAGTVTFVANRPVGVDHDRAPSLHSIQPRLERFDSFRAVSMPCWDPPR